MDISPSPAFRRAAVEILGSDSPNAVIGAMEAAEQRPINAVRERHIEIQNAMDRNEAVPPLSPAAAAIRDELIDAYRMAAMSPEVAWSQIASGQMKLVP